MEINRDLRLAVLIDADNVPHGAIREMLEEISKYGTPTFKRIYADWTNPHVTRWKSILLEHAIQPVQQYSYTTGKNSTDSALIIDAMDILYTGKVDGFCIVSSDSDFTRLATRLREAGMKVIGMGEKKTLNPFVSACDKFIYIEILKQKNGTRAAQSQEMEKPVADPLNKIDPEIIRAVVDTVRDVEDENGWAFLGEIGNLLIKKMPDFDPRNYGFAKMLPMFKSMDRFEIDVRESSRPNIKHIYIRLQRTGKRK